MTLAAADRKFPHLHAGLKGRDFEIRIANLAHHVIPALNQWLKVYNTPEGPRASNLVLESLSTCTGYTMKKSDSPNTRN